MKNFKQLLMIIAFISIFSYMTEDCFAQRRGGSRSWGSSKSSKSWGSSSKSKSSWGSSSKKSKAKTSSSKSSSKWSNKTKASSSRPKTKTETKKSKISKDNYKKAVQNGTAFKTKEAAAKDFKSKHASKYTNKYEKEPTTRPNHIPQTTQHNGQQVNINYNQSQGGYGHWSGGSPGIGTWIMYDAMSDMVMMSILMNQNNYHVGPAPTTQYQTTSAQTAVVQKESKTPIIIVILGWIVVIVVCSLLVVFIFANLSI